MLNCATLVKFYSNYSLSFAGAVNLALAPFICSAQYFFDSLFQLKIFPQHGAINDSCVEKNISIKY